MTDRRHLPAALLLAGFAYFLPACSGAGGAEPAAEFPPLAVAAGPVEPAVWSSELEVTGGVEPVRRAMPGTILMGRVEEILRREGDRVRSGETLARIASRDVEAGLAQAQANVSAARAGEEYARRMKERMERLHARQAASQKNLDEAVAGYEAAAAQLRAAEEGVEAARVHLAYAEVRAPFAGVVAERRIDLGDIASPGMPLFVVEDLSRMKIEAQVSESALRGLAAGDPVDVVVSGASDQARQGSLEEILPSGDPRSRTFTVRVLLPNTDGSLKTGMFARLKLPGDAREALTAPEAAVVRRGPLAGLYVVDGSGRARLRWVTLGEARADRVEVLTGLQAGERIVLAPPEDLSDGRRVEVR